MAIADGLGLEGWRCIAIGHWWEFAPTTAQDFDVLFVVVALDGHLEGLKPSAPWKRWFEEKAPSVRRYRIELPPLQHADTDFGLSGVLGLVTPNKVQISNERSAAFERAASDILLWEISASELHSPFPITLLRGPLLPKLRGRLFYRSFHPDMDLAFITFDPEWLQRLTPRLRHRQSRTGGSSRALTWEGPLPSLAIDEGSRCFILKSNDTPRFMIEAPSNTWDPGSGQSWWNDRQLRYEKLFEDPWVADFRDVQGINPSLTGLPVPLAAACAMAEKECANALKNEMALSNLRRLMPELKDRFPTAPSPRAPDKLRIPRLKPLDLAFNALQHMSGARTVSEGGSSPDLPQAAELRSMVFETLADKEKGELMGTYVDALARLPTLEL